MNYSGWFVKSKTWELHVGNNVCVFTREVLGWTISSLNDEQVVPLKESISLYSWLYVSQISRE